MLGNFRQANVVNDTLLYTLKECPITKLEIHECNTSKISDGVVGLGWLKHLCLVRCDNIQSIPNLPGNITSIRALECSSLVTLPCNISDLKSLTHLRFNRCPKLGIEFPHLIMKVKGLTNLAHLTMACCSVRQVPNKIGRLVSLKELDLSGNTFYRLPDTLSNLSQLVDLNIEGCQRLRLLPLLPSNLINIHARLCDSLDVMSSASLRTKVCKDSPFRNRFMIYLSWHMNVPDWCSCQSRGDIISFVAPVHLDNICGIILCVNTLKYFNRHFVPNLHNKTKNTSHPLVTKNAIGPYSLTFSCFRRQYMIVMSYPLDDTTLVVEPGDSLILELPHDQGSITSSALRLIYETDVVNYKLVFQTVTQP
ncbi:hypothetical protein QVD17_22144 [Tagetes erecta]|uniref:Disease resistance protein n=1 Tax=Tagetes erecta TaxID=13708 RepID=A0AAD8NTW3_TARER|nr:hypothetical protein QVD17_22144 [Tagetes erecta]